MAQRNAALRILGIKKIRYQNPPRREKFRNRGTRDAAGVRDLRNPWNHQKVAVLEKHAEIGQQRLKTRKNAHLSP